MILYSLAYTRAGYFIIGATGSDKLMLYGSSVARAAPTISAVNKTKKSKFVIRRKNPLWRRITK